MTLIHLFAGYCAAIAIMLLAYHVVTHVCGLAYAAFDRLRNIR